MLGSTIRQLRDARDLTQTALAQKARIHRVYLAKIEGGVQEPSLTVLRRIAAALDVSVAHLLEPHGSKEGWR